MRKVDTACIFSLYANIYVQSPGHHSLVGEKWIDYDYQEFKIQKDNYPVALKTLNIC